MTQRNTRTKRIPSEPENGKRDTRPPLAALISLQLQTEFRDLKHLDNLLLSIYLVRLGTLLDRGYDRYCEREHGISGGDMGVLFALRRSGPPFVSRPTDLFRVLLVTSGAITKKVDRLAEVGCVERLPDPGHKGGFQVRLTKKGLRMVDGAAKHLALNSALGPAIAEMKPEERKAGSDFVLKLLASLDKGD